MAGALGVQLGGKCFYQGVLSEKPPLGQPVEPLCLEKAHQAIRIMLATSWLTLLIAAAVVLACRVFNETLI
jgi:cobalamin biosynthesis protein CobD/CbiB